MKADMCSGEVYRRPIKELYKNITRGKVTYTRDSKAKNAKIKVTSKGKVTIPKNCKNGTCRNENGAC